MILVLPFSISINYYKFEYKNSSNRFTTENVVVRGFLCNDYPCKNQFIGDLWEGQTKLSNTDGAIYNIVLSLPTTSEVTSDTKSHIFFSQTLNYLPRAKIILPAPQKPNTYTNPFLLSDYTINFEKISSCSSPVSLSVVNNNRVNLPVSVTSGANMSSTTLAAFGFEGNVYTGWIRNSEFQKYYEIETTLHLKIYRYNATTSKNIGSAIHSEDVVKRIYYDDTVNVAFADWMPPAQTADFLYYNVSVESDITNLQEAEQLR